MSGSDYLRKKVKRVLGSAALNFEDGRHDDNQSRIRGALVDIAMGMGFQFPDECERLLVGIGVAKETIEMCKDDWREIGQ